MTLCFRSSVLSEGRGRSPRSSRLAFSGLGPLALESKQQQPSLRLSWAAAPNVQLLLHEQGLMEEGGLHRSTPPHLGRILSDRWLEQEEKHRGPSPPGRKALWPGAGQGELCVPQAAAVWGGVSILLSCELGGRERAWFGIHRLSPFLPSLHRYLPK